MYLVLDQRAPPNNLMATGIGWTIFWLRNFCDHFGYYCCGGYFKIEVYGFTADGK